MGGGGVGGGGGGRASWESRDKWDPQIKWDELLGEVSFTHARSSRLAASAGDKGLEDKSRRKPWISRPIFSPLKMSFVVQYYCICSPAYFVLLLARALRLRAHQSPSPSCLDPVNCIWRRSLLCTSFAPKHAQPDETSLLFRKTTKSSRRRRRRAVFGSFRSPPPPCLPFIFVYLLSPASPPSPLPHLRLCDMQNRRPRFSLPPFQTGS